MVYFFSFQIPKRNHFKFSAETQFPNDHYSAIFFILKYSFRAQHGEKEQEQSDFLHTPLVQCILFIYGIT